MKFNICVLLTYAKNPCMIKFPETFLYYHYLLKDNGKLYELLKKIVRLFLQCKKYY